MITPPLVSNRGRHDPREWLQKLERDVAAAVSVTGCGRGHLTGCVAFNTRIVSPNLWPVRRENTPAFLSFHPPICWCLLSAEA